MSPAASKKPAKSEEPAGPPVLARLLCKTGANAGLAFGLSSERPSVVGRTQGASLIVPDPLVSREHARIAFDAGHFYVENLSGTNGTLLNGLPVQREALEHLDVLGFGPDSEFIFRLERGASAPAAPGGPIRAAVLLPAGSSGARIELQAGSSTLGRAAGNTVVLEMKAISSQHARFDVSPAEVQLEDLGSANGTTVNDQRFTGKLRLNDGDVVTFGKVVSFVVQFERESAPEAGPPAPPSGWRLVGEEDGLVLNLPSEPGHYVVGRESGCQLILENKKSVSRRHAEMSLDESGRLNVRDLASGNGTFVNGVKIRESVLNVGDRLQIGLVGFRVEARP